jgi:hypothetical protein
MIADQRSAHLSRHPSRGVVNVVRWLTESGYGNVVLEIANEYGHDGFDHPIFKNPEGQVELIQLAKETAPELLVSTSGGGSGTLHNVRGMASCPLATTKTP